MNKQIIIGSVVVVIILLVGIYVANHKNSVEPLPTGQVQNVAVASSSQTTASGTIQNTTAQQTATSPSASAPASSQTTSKPATQTSYGNKVILGDVKSGSFITVQQAVLSAPGYIVLFRVNSKGQSDMIGHSSLLSKGSHLNTQIQINTVVAYQQQVVALLVRDNGYATFQFPIASAYLMNSVGDIASDISVVGVASVSNESKTLGVSLETYFKSLVTQTSSSTAQ